MKKVGIVLLLVLSICLCACHHTKEQRFEKIARELTNKCPLAINEFTRLDSVVYDSQNNINQYYYTLLGVADSQEKMITQESEMKTRLIREIDNSVEMKEYKDFNTTLEYIYYSEKDGHVLLKITLTPKEYE